MKNDHLFRTAFEHSSIGMALVSSEGKWLQANPSLSKMIGITHDDLILKTFQEITHPEDLEADLVFMNECVNGQRESYSIEKRFFSSKGELIWVRQTVSKIIREGSLLFIFQVENISESKMTQQKLISALKLATLGEMAAAIAHEIRTPLNVIVNCSDFIQKDISKDQANFQKMASKIELIDKTVQRICTIIDGMNNLSRDGELSSIRAVGLRDLLNETLLLVKMLIKEDHVLFDVSVDERIIVECKKVELGQVFLNLINNSLYALKNTINKKISIRADVVDNFVEVLVSDNGCGVLPEIKNKLMSPFFTTKPMGEGTGLGLSLSREMMHKMKGSLDYLDQEELTTFRLRIPLCQKNQEFVA